MSDNSLKNRLQQLRGVAVGVAATVVLSPAPVNAQENTVQNNDVNSNNITLNEQEVKHHMDASATIGFMEAKDSLEINHDTNVLSVNQDKDVELKQAMANIDQRALDVGRYKPVKLPNSIKKEPKVKTITPDSPDYNPRASASYSAKGNVITMQISGEKPTAEEIERAHYNEMAKSTEYHNGDQVSQNATYFHERGHWATYSQSGSEKLKYPADIYRIDRLDEKRSIAIEYLYIANQYSILKQQGLETYEVNGEKRPLDNMLEFYPGLKDYVKEHGFDAKNPEDIRALTETSSRYWDKTYSNPYKSQHYSAAINTSETPTVFDCIKTDQKTYDEVANKMMTGVYIGHETYVDLPREILDNYSHENTMNDLREKTVWNRRETSTTFGDVEKINEYFVAQGINNDKEKDKLLHKAFEQTTKDSGKTMDVVLDGMLSEMNKSKTYTDTSSEIKKDDNTTIVAKDGKQSDYVKMQTLRGVLTTPQNNETQNISQINQEVLIAQMQAQQHKI